MRGPYEGPVAMPRRGSDVAALQATVALALLMHLLGLLIVTVYVPNRSSESGFFASPPEIEVRRVQRVEMKKAPPPPPPPPPAPAPRPAAVPLPRPAAAPRGPAAVRAPSGGGRAPVLASNRGRGFAVAPSNGVNGTGQGSGPGTGTGPGGPGGGTGPGGPGGYQPPPPPPPPSANPAQGSEATQAVPLYDPFRECVIPMPATNFQADPNTRNIASWQDLCQRVGTVTWAELSSRPYVKPFLLWHPELGLGDQDALRGRSGTVQVRVTVHANRTTTAMLLTQTGTPEFDRVGYAVASGIVFLPALRMGKEVEDTVDFTINFTTFNPNGGGPVGPPGGGPAPAP